MLSLGEDRWSRDTSSTNKSSLAPPRGEGQVVSCADYRVTQKPAFEQARCAGTASLTGQHSALHITCPYVSEAAISMLMLVLRA
jgi:hypothetical protein